MATLFSKPKIPKPVVPKTVPIADEAAIAENRRRKVATAQQRGGRQSTILSQGDTLGGG